MPTEQGSPVPRRKLGIFAAAAGIVALLVVVTGIRAREDSSAKLREWTDNQAIPTVAVVLPDAKVLNATIDLPGRLEAYSRAPIFARVSGYLKSWNVDIGTQVKAGQVIAEIEAPDLDQQLLQARADLASAQSSARLSEATLNRRKTLVASNFVSAQEIDERTADLANKKAAVNSGPPMFVVSDVTKLRVYVNVPQNYVPAIRIGAKAVLTMPEYPNRTFAATVEASSQSVDVGSGTTRMQLALDNAGGELMPGAYANVRLPLERDAVPLHIPASALIFNKDGLRVATVGPNDKVLFKTVTIARDLGKEIELASGLAADDRIITAPPDGIADGDQVRVVGAGAKGKPATASEKQDVKG